MTPLEVHRNHSFCVKFGAKSPGGLVVAPSKDNLKLLTGQGRLRFLTGFTLIETIVAIGIFSIAMLALGNFILAMYKTQSYSLNQSQAIREARKGVETMVKEIREAQMAENGAYAIEKTNDYEFTFYGDIDRDSTIEKVRYFINGTDFKKGVTEPTSVLQLTDLPAQYPSQNEQVSVLSRYVRNVPPIFHYYDDSGNELPAPARRKDTTIMMLHLVINIDPNRLPGDFVLESKAQIRNLKDNL
jgi:prepilin-type N-terminal cleavage/methylation domain-containing protein